MAEDLFRFPWPGPGNSEGPVDPDRRLQVETNDASAKGLGNDTLSPPHRGQARAIARPEEQEAE